MANIKQQIKRSKTNDKAKAANAGKKTRLKNVLKQTLIALDGKKSKESQAALNLAFKTLDKAQSSGIVHKNYVARQKSKLAKLAQE
jgi:small subunit ribosomal protein S20